MSLYNPFPCSPQSRRVQCAAHDKLPLLESEVRSRVFHGMEELLHRRQRIDVFESRVSSRYPCKFSISQMCQRKISTDQRCAPTALLRFMSSLSAIR